MPRNACTRAAASCAMSLASEGKLPTSSLCTLWLCGHTNGNICHESIMTTGISRIATPSDKRTSRHALPVAARPRRYNLPLGILLLIFLRTSASMKPDGEQVVTRANARLACVRVATRHSERFWLTLGRWDAVESKETISLCSPRTGGALRSQHASCGNGAGCCASEAIEMEVGMG